MKGTIMRFTYFDGKERLSAIEKDDTVEKIAAHSHMTVNELCRAIFDMVHDEPDQGEEAQECR